MKRYSVLTIMLIAVLTIGLLAGNVSAIQVSTPGDITVSAIPTQTEVSATVTVSAPIDLGNNKVKYILNGAITANRATLVRYRWIRSDGNTPYADLGFLAAGTRNVTYEWIVAKTLQTQDLWAAISLTYTTGLESDKAKFSLPAYVPKVTGVTVTASQPPVDDQGGNNIRLNFTGTITTDGPTTVKYRWKISETNLVSQGDKEILFNAAGSKTVSGFWLTTKTYQQNRKVTATIEVFAPNSLTSLPYSMNVPYLIEPPH